MAVITGELKSKVDAVWDAFWTGGISNPLEVMEQITYLLFIRRLDDEQTLALNRANTLGEQPVGNPFPVDRDELRWSVFKNFSAEEMFETVDQQVFPYIKTMRDEDSTYAHFMKDARLSIPNAAMLVRVVDRLDKIEMRGWTPMAISTNTCSPRSPPPGRTGSSALRVTSSSSWSR